MSSKKSKNEKIQSSDSNYTKRSGKSFFKTALIGFVVIIVLCIVIGVGVVVKIIKDAPSINNINVAPTNFATTIYDTEGNVVRKLVGSDANREYVKLDKIPKAVQNAFIAIEDERFWEHRGIDVKGILRALVKGITSGNFSQGASTITQQLLKNSVFEGGNEPNFAEKLERKIQEQYLAVKLEDKMSKEQILEYYLNTINLGQNTLGVQAASKRYFGKDISELTVSEAAVIAGITKNPTNYNPITNPEKNAERRSLVLANMKTQGYITQKQYDTAMQDKVYKEIQVANEKFQQNNISYNSYFDDELISQVSKDLQEKLGVTEDQAMNMLYRGGLKIVTTQNKTMQEICDRVINDPANYPMSSDLELTYRLSIQKTDGTKKHYSEGNLRNYFAKKTPGFDILFQSKEEAVPYVEEFKESVLEEGDEVIAEVFQVVAQPQVSFVLMDQYNGEVLAIVGGRGEKTGNRTLNRATSSKRQPGSTFKVLSTFLPAIDQYGMTLANIEDDTKYYYPGTNREVSNWSRSGYKGFVTMREAIKSSMNIVSVKTLAKVTPEVGMEYLKQLGITTMVEKRENSAGQVFSDLNLSMALGGITDGVTNLELTAAYAAIANEGVYTKPRFYTEIYDNNGNLLIENKPETRQVMKQSTAWLLTNAMEDVVKSGTGTLVRFTSKNMPISGKTGTTSNDLDLWFTGFTPYYTGSIWGGYDNNKDQVNTTYHKVIWRKIMEEIHQNLETKTFSKPDTIVAVRICNKSGKLAVPGVCDHESIGNHIYTEYFAKGTVPTQSCDVHVKYEICSESKMRVSEFCPEEVRVEKVYMIKSETGTTADTPYLLPKDLPDSSCDIHITPEPPETPEVEGEEEEDNEDIQTTPDSSETPEFEEEGEDNGEPPVIENQSPITPPVITPTPEENLYSGYNGLWGNY